MAAHFHSLPVKRVTPDAAGSAAITLAVPDALRSQFDFRPGQFVTLRAAIDGEDTRRSYSICSPHQRYAAQGEFDVGIKPEEGGRFSRWAASQLRAGDVLAVMPPDGRFTPHDPQARHRVGFAAGSGITPILSIIATTLADEPDSRFTLAYCNQRANTIMFNEALQDLKDRYPARLTLIHLLSRQPQEVQLLHGRLDETKVSELLEALIPATTIDEAFICGPEAMIEGAERAL
jgi:ring-1,2-phenylacetyl-CoA epoxidase subunit PaaE